MELVENMLAFLIKNLSSGVIGIRQEYDDIAFIITADTIDGSDGLEDISYKIIDDFYVFNNKVQDDY